MYWSAETAFFPVKSRYPNTTRALITIHSTQIFTRPVTVDRKSFLCYALRLARNTKTGTSYNRQSVRIISGT